MAKSPLAPVTIDEQLATFEPSKNEHYDPGKIIILFDARTLTTADVQQSPLQAYYTSTLSRLGWPSIWTPDVPPAHLRLIWYTHAGNEGTRDFPLHKAEEVKEMYDYLAFEGYRPMMLGWSGENPYPMLGGETPEKPREKPKVKVSTSWSGTVSGHASQGTPHDRVMAIIGEDEKREAKKREEEVRIAEKARGIDGAV